MKKALVYVKEIDGRSVGSVAMKMESAELDKWTHHHVSGGFAQKIEVPAELEELPESQLKGVLIQAQPESWTDGVDTVFTAPEDMTGWTYQPAVAANWEIQKGDTFIAYDKQKRVGEKFALLNSEVEEEMKQVYNTTNPDSAVANYLTWLSMKNDPAKYANKGLIARFNVVGLSIGDALNTSQKVQDYATALIDLADDYAIWREQKILAFVAEKTAIEAE